MLNRLIPYGLGLKARWPKLYRLIVAIAKRYLAGPLGVYPRPLANEAKAVEQVLKSCQWNMALGKGLVHEALETEFAEYVGARHAVAVNTGGVALQMSMRALGLKPGDEVVLQIDTCSAAPLAVMNAFCTPLFADTSQQTFMLSEESLRKVIGPRTKAVIATHIWGNPEDLEVVSEFAKERGLFLIEDACLALGAMYKGKRVGSWGDLGVFSFGCQKSIQAGEGGMIVTNDAALARELRAMRHWGDRTIEFGVRDTVALAWNGRMSEIVAAVVREQLKGYPSHLHSLRDAVAEFQAFLSRLDGLDMVLGSTQPGSLPSFAQVVLRIDEGRLGWRKGALMDALFARGIPVWHANYELVNSLSFFRRGNWRVWSFHADAPRVAANYAADFPIAKRVYESIGMGLGKMNFLSSNNLRHLVRQIDHLVARRPA
jgi:dTDP-4-amino-4,6-dideoxygalactose transaminase